MIKQEISEIKKLYTPNNCSITRLCGCYVDGEKNKKALIKQAFLSLPEEDIFKYFEILRKSLSGTVGKNLLTLDFPLASEQEGGTQEALLALRDSKLKDDTLLEAFYDRIIESYDYVGNYLILLVHDMYDVPGKTLDGLTMDDASDNVYEYILCCICPVNLSKPALSYHAEESMFSNRDRDWIVAAPECGFLFPAYHDRGSDLHSTLYYSKNAAELKESFVEALLGCPLPLTADDQKETFNLLVEEALGETCDIEKIKTIHETLNEMIEDHKEDATPLLLHKNEVKNLLAKSGVDNEKLEEFDKHFEETAGEKTELLADNVVNARTFEVKTPDIVVKVNPERTDLVNTQTIDGKRCLVIELDGSVEVNGINLRQ
jgi:hypothetical protein